MSHSIDLPKNLVINTGERKADGGILLWISHKKDELSLLRMHNLLLILSMNLIRLQVKCI